MLPVFAGNAGVSIGIKSQNQGILIDSRKSQQFHADNFSHIMGETSFGGNFAKGWNDNRLLELSMECLRKESEKMAVFRGVSLCHSLIGGTGGGFGSRFLQGVNEEYQKISICSQLILPFTSESCLQHYNSLLGLASIHESCDGVFLFDNECILQQSLAADGRSGAQVTLKDINLRMSDTINSFHLSKAVSTAPKKRPFSWQDLLLDVVPLKRLNFAECIAVPPKKNAFELKDLVAKLSKSLPRFDALNRPVRCFSASMHIHVIPRMLKKDEFFPFNSFRNAVAKQVSFAEWNPIEESLKMRAMFADDSHMVSKKSSRQRLVSEMGGITVVANRSSVASLFQHVLDKSISMLDAKAFLHWYTKEGFESAQFDEAQDKLLNLFNNYEEC
eukprot:TRINITY_DN82525_c0_g1_i1.p1 TRINITY_DN82525_c0_g1~~TRINITY_DN82525_c0_g1_i1.p1  ORF type:complete len:388 (+),score=57.60 TRINITY_DN82525_c0_g1_i1:44-1207(+)